MSRQIRVVAPVMESVIAIVKNVGSILDCAKACEPEMVHALVGEAPPLSARGSPRRRRNPGLSILVDRGHNERIVFCCDSILQGSSQDMSKRS